MAISYPSTAASIPTPTPQEAIPGALVPNSSIWESYLLANERAYEQAKLHDARQWDSMKYQIAANDLLKAGLNPWLAVQNGLSGAGSNVNANASTSSSSATSLHSYSNSMNSKSNSSESKSHKVLSFVKDIASSAFKVAGLLAVLG